MIQAGLALLFCFFYVQVQDANISVHTCILHPRTSKCSEVVYGLACSFYLQLSSHALGRLSAFVSRVFENEMAPALARQPHPECENTLVDKTALPCDSVAACPAVDCCVD